MIQCRTRGAHKVLYPLPRKIVRLGLPFTETLRSGSRPFRGLSGSVG
jgi:hypothetical protein